MTSREKKGTGNSFRIGMLHAADRVETAGERSEQGGRRIFPKRFAEEKPLQRGPLFGTGRGQRDEVLPLDFDQ